MKAIKLFVSMIILILLIALCRDIIVRSISNQRSKTDYAELNHIKYGLFNIEEWKRQIAVILADELDRIDLSEANQLALRKHIETTLASLIDEVDKKVREGNAVSATGRLKQSFIDVFVSVDEIKKGVPSYADVVMKEMKKREVKGRIKSALSKRLNRYFDKTFSAKNNAQIARILQENDLKDVKSARTGLHTTISTNHDLVVKEAVLLIVAAVILFSLAGFNRRPVAPATFQLLIFTLLLLLAAGVTTPMIDIEAKISQLSFVLIGHTIQFDNQVLYFQSKSILDVFRIMMTHKDLQMKFVGVLLITFSIFFPLLKILSSVVYYRNYRNARENPVIAFFVLKSGKWSMADVMVIAMFMTYIGFNGIITSQLGQLNEAAPQLELLATNGTSLQPGFYLFLTFVLLGLFLSAIITRKPPVAAPENP